MAKLKNYYSRCFLNKKKGVAAVEWNVDPDNDKSKSANFKVSDCNRSANLEFTYWNDEMKAERLYKLDKLISELQMFRAALFPAQDQKE